MDKKVTLEKYDGLGFMMLEALIVLVYCNPVANLMPSLVQIIVFVLWALATARNKHIWGRGLSLAFVNIIIFTISFLRCAVAGQFNLEFYSPFNSVITRYQLVVYPVLFIYVINLPQNMKKKVFNLSLLCMTITGIFSLYYIFFVDQQAVRNLRTDLWGIGDSMQIYTMTALCGPLILVIKSRMQQKINSFYLIAALLIFVMCILSCKLVTSIVMLILSVYISYVVSRKDRELYILIVIPAVILAALVLRKVFAELIYMLTDTNMLHFVIKNKLIAIANVLNGSMTKLDTLSGRSRLASWSMQSFRENVFFGINWANHKFGTIGCHMQWADDMGRYGLIGNLILWSNYLMLAHKIITYNRAVLVKNSLLSALLSTFILGFLNPYLSVSTLMLLFVVIPSFESQEELNVTA